MPVIKKITPKTKKEVSTKVLKSKAVKNLDVKGTSTVPSKEGIPLDTRQQTKDLLSDNKVVGVAVGMTKNMGDYESLRIDTWLSQPVSSDSKEKETKQAMVQMQDLCVEVIEDFLKEFVEE